MSAEVESEMFTNVDEMVTFSLNLEGFPIHRSNQNKPNNQFHDRGAVGMPLLRSVRHQAILEALRGCGGATVTALSQQLRVTEQTIRRDLTELELSGLIYRSHGGAVLRPVNGDVSYRLRLGEAVEEKARIAAVAASLVQPGETVLLDAGTTTLALARALVRTEQLRLITNALPVATELAALPDAHVVLLGGQLRPTTLSTLGPTTKQELSQVRAHKLFLAAGGVDPCRGLTAPNMMEAEVKQAMIQAASDVFVIAHGSKLGRAQAYSFAPLRVANVLITTDSAPQSVLNQIRELGVEVIIA